MRLLSVLFLGLTLFVLSCSLRTEEQFKGYEHYVVRSGDSVRAIAKAYNISRTELLVANLINENHPLVSGRVLRIPGLNLAVIKRVESEELEWRGGNKHLKGSDTPFTGKAYRWYKNGLKYEEINYKDGKEEGLKTQWHGNGQKRSEHNFKDGVEISAKSWNSKGEQAKGLRDQD
jgi:LysM repeat protein